MLVENGLEAVKFVRHQPVNSAVEEAPHTGLVVDGPGEDEGACCMCGLDNPRRCEVGWELR